LAAALSRAAAGRLLGVRLLLAALGARRRLTPAGAGLAAALSRAAAGRPLRRSAAVCRA